MGKRRSLSCLTGFLSASSRGRPQHVGKDRLSRSSSDGRSCERAADLCLMTKRTIESQQTAADIIDHYIRIGAVVVEERNEAERLRLAVERSSRAHHEAWRLQSVVSRRVGAVESVE